MYQDERFTTKSTKGDTTTHCGGGIGLATPLTSSTSAEERKSAFGKRPRSPSRERYGEKRDRTTGFKGRRTHDDTTRASTPSFVLSDDPQPSINRRDHTKPTGDRHLSRVSLPSDFPNSALPSYQRCLVPARSYVQILRSCRGATRRSSVFDMVNRASQLVTRRQSTRTIHNCRVEVPSQCLWIH
ncbi:uncharacterized protein LOC143353592 [Halictus rubicundus]|uniref:uncharacterized protein LOC143353592 n=1 Tax=Halictus rubicundus TaxID=77578 RepID=UPI0040368743